MHGGFKASEISSSSSSAATSVVVGGSLVFISTWLVVGSRVGFSPDPMRGRAYVVPEAGGLDSEAPASESRRTASHTKPGDMQ